MIGLGGVLTCIMTNTRRARFVVLPGFKATSCLTVVLLVCLETVLLSTVSNCAKTFYMHWNTTNSIFRIDNTDHIIDVNKGNLAFEYDQVHIICPVYEPGTFDNETEKYIIYNVSKVEYETCRITNANPRIIAICDKPQKLMFFTITFRPFTPQPGGLEFLPGNDYYFISTSSKDDLHRRIGGRCSTNNMKVVFKVCCAPDEQQQQQQQQSSHLSGTSSSGSSPSSSSSSSVANGASGSSSSATNQQPNTNGHHQHSSSSSSSGVSINTNIEQQTNRLHQQNGDGSSQQQHTITGGGGGGSSSGGSTINGRPVPSVINTNSSNVVQSTISWPIWSNSHHSLPVTTTLSVQQFYPHMTSPRPNINSANNNNNHSNYSPSHKPTKKTNEYDKHPNEVVKNEELTYNSNSSCYLRPNRTLQHLLIIALSILIKFTNLMHSSSTSSNWCQR